MSLSKVWVYAESCRGQADLAHARAADQGTSSSATRSRRSTPAPTPAAVAPALGAYGAAKVHAAAELEWRAARVPRSRRRWPSRSQRSRPDLVMFGMTYEARDVMGRLSVKIDRRS